jgi:dipeptidase
MCDTLVALGAATSAGATLFAKNSDRERNEAQGLELVPARDNAEGSPLRLTYISIPQVAHTHACLISRPFWMWGAEMGTNAHGVAIGNEAVHSVVAPSETAALTGMDLVRLGLERAASAQAAVEVITDLLERHGQGGDCGHLEPFRYHNSFIVADPAEAFVLEAVGRLWAVQKVERVKAISNVLGIGAANRRVGAAAQAHAELEGWCEAGGAFDFAARLWDPERDVATRGVERCARATDLLTRCGYRIEVADMMHVLRDHGAAAESDSKWSPAKIVGRTICMHAGHGDRRSQTVGSMVSELRPETAVHWVTGSSAPCLSVFKPVILWAGLPDQGAVPTDRYDAGARWWRHECVHRAALQDFQAWAQTFAASRDALEHGFRERIDAALAADRGLDHLRRETAACWHEADEAEARWEANLRSAQQPTSSPYRESWNRLSQLAGMASFEAIQTP